MARTNNFRPWAFWRRVQYGTGTFVVIAAFSTLLYFMVFAVPPTCFDGRQNGSETGVDCGGACMRICAVSVVTPTVVWAESFAVTDGQYNAVAYIDNRNVIAGTPRLDYIFRLYDDAGLITERSGNTVLPPNNSYPIFEGRIDTGSRVPTRTTVELTTADLWLPFSNNRAQFRTVNLQLQGADERPRLNVQMENTALTESQNVEVIATIFDTMGNPLTASQTFVERFGARSQTDITFTWPEPIAKTVRSCEVPSDIMLVLDRSGSMAADSSDPPQPLTNAKAAAQTFVQQLRPTDQLGYFSYATTPSSPLEQTLTANLVEAEAAIEKTVMGTDGVQYTDMGAAFSSAASELLSVRHRADARKVIVFLTDGDVTRPLNPETGERDIEYAANFARNAAEAAKDQDIIIYTIGFGDFFAQIDGLLDRDVDLIADLASDPAKSFLAPTINDLRTVYRDIAEDICEDGAARIDVIVKPSADVVPGL